MPSPPQTWQNMDSVRLPPLNFNTQPNPSSLNCVLPPISPPPRPMPRTPSAYPSDFAPSASVQLDIPAPPNISASPPALTSPSCISPPVLTASTSAGSLQAPSPHMRIALQPLSSPSAHALTSPPPAISPLPTSSQIVIPPLPPISTSQPITPSVPQSLSPASNYGEGLVLSGNNSAIVNPASSWQYSAPLPRIESQLATPPAHMPREAGPMHLGQLAAQSSASDLSAENGAPQSGSPEAGSQTMPPRCPVKKTISTPRGMREVYACPFENCDRVSTEHSNMKAHMRMHTGERPYVCRNAGCMKSFRWKSSLTYHEKALHTKARPYKCIPCRKSFVEKRKLKMHYDLCPALRRSGTQGIQKQKKMHHDMLQ